jgi:glutaredoxin-like YruB-family protein
MTIKIYSTSSCPWCTVAKNYFRERGVKFTDYGVDRDPAKYEEMVRKSHQMGVPVIDMGGKILVGFNKAEIERQLAKASPVTAG